MRVLIADDHGIVRSGLRLLLERQPDIEVVAEAADGAEARELAVRERPDLAILDVKMPKLTGLQATREIKQQAPEVAVLILSMHDDERYLFEALKAGASGYVLKTQADTDLLAAIRAVERGEPFLTPEAQRALIKDVLERGPDGEEELTPREEEIVKLVAEAHTTKQIAEILHLSEKTVENHRANAMRKLGMRDRVELVRYAIRRGLIEPVTPSCVDRSASGRELLIRPISPGRQGGARRRLRAAQPRDPLPALLRPAGAAQRAGTCVYLTERRPPRPRGARRDRARHASWIVGVARYVRSEDPTEAEVAVVVGDPWQGRGVALGAARPARRARPRRTASTISSRSSSATTRTRSSSSAASPPTGRWIRRSGSGQIEMLIELPEAGGLAGSRLGRVLQHGRPRGSQGQPLDASSGEAIRQAADGGDEALPEG